MEEATLIRMVQVCIDRECCAKRITIVCMDISISSTKWFMHVRIRRQNVAPVIGVLWCERTHTSGELNTPWVANGGIWPETLYVFHSQLCDCFSRLISARKVYSRTDSGVWLRMQIRWPELLRGRRRKKLYWSMRSARHGVFLVRENSVSMHACILLIRCAWSLVCACCFVHMLAQIYARAYASKPHVCHGLGEAMGQRQLGRSSTESSLSRAR